MTDALDLDAIEARANAATPGPWEFTLREGFPCFSLLCEKLRGDGYHTFEIDTCDGKAIPTAQFISASRADVPALCARVRELERQQGRAWAEAECDRVTANLNAVCDERDALKARLKLAEAVCEAFEGCSNTRTQAKALEAWRAARGPAK